MKSTLDILLGREKFVRTYCVKKNWPLNPIELTIEQILEIRKQKDWKNPK